jgi:hypothetical protein
VQLIDHAIGKISTEAKLSYPLEHITKIKISHSYHMNGYKVNYINVVQFPYNICNNLTETAVLQRFQLSV